MTEREGAQDVREALASLLAERQAAEIAERDETIRRLREALQWYADGDHLYGSLPDDWDDCSDHETAGWRWPCEPVQDESWGVEDGLVARAALKDAP